jgi:hypothetical protein
MSDKITTDGDGVRYVYCEPAQAWVLWCPCGPHEDCPEHLFNCVIDPGPPAFVNGQTANS